MKDSSKRNTVTMWFDTELFHVNGKPLKFHLEGYNEIEFCNLVKIIEAYGGELSEPTEDTIIFSEPDHPVGIHQRYNLKYIRDSIMANQLLELEKYELPSATNHQHWDVKNCDEVTPEEKNLERIHAASNDLSRKIRKECMNKRTDSASISSRESCSGDDSCTAIRTKALVLNKRKIKQMEDATENKKFCNRDTIPKKESVIHNEDPISLRTRSKNRRKSLNDHHSSSDETIRHQKQNRRNYTKEETRQMIQYLIDKNAIRRGKALSIWQEMIADLKITRRTQYSMRSHFCKILKKGCTQFTEDVNAREEFKQLYSTKFPRKHFFEEENRRIMQYLIKKNLISRAANLDVWKEVAINTKVTRTAFNLRAYFQQRLKFKYRKYTNDAHAHKEFEKLGVNEPRRTYKKFTDEENRQIIQYIIDSDSISRTKSRKFWKKMVADNFPSRNPESVRGHFSKDLKYQYKKYTEDVNAHKEFEKLLEFEAACSSESTHRRAERSLKNRRWTEEENQFMIDYLIKNDVIYRANSKAVWREAWKEAGKANRRTADGFHNHFRYYLRRNYSKYTSDPRALKKFAAIEKKMGLEKANKIA